MFCRSIIGLLFGITACNALFFIVKKDERKCFTLEQPRDTPIVFAYEIMDEKHDVEFCLYYGTMGLAQFQIMNNTLSKSVGHVDFTTDNSGSYTACMRQISSDNTEFPTRFSLAVSYGYDGEYYIKLAKENDFDVLNMEIHKLNDIMSLTLNEADFQKHKEAVFHQETEDMQIETIWWPIFQVMILVVAGYVQVLHLKNFFKSRKLI